MKTPDRHRLAEAIASLSLATDIGMGQPMEKGLRTAMLAAELASRAGLPVAEQSDAYYLGLLIHIGCTSTALEYASFTGGEDNAMRARLVTLVSEPVEEQPTHVYQHLLEVAPADRREEAVKALMSNPQRGHELLTGQCEAANLLVRQMRLPESLCRAIAQIYERWDGHGVPGRLEGEGIDVAVRLVQVAHDAEVFHRAGGVEYCLSELGRRASTGGFDPTLARLMAAGAAEMFAGLPVENTWSACMAAEPASHRTVGDSGLDDVVLAVGQFADLKGLCLLGHSSGVAHLAAAAMQALGSDEREIATVRRAGHVHDIGRIGVSSGTWNKPRPLSESEFERVRLHAYFGERVLTRPGPLGPLAGIAAAHHERMDGSGYHRGLDASRLSMAARVLCAADAFDAMTHDRPYRRARKRSDAAAELSRDTDAGKFDRAAVEAVLAVAGETATISRRERPGGLSEREIEVVRLLCRGLTNAQVSDRLGISAKTVGRHVENIYGKAAVSTRASITLWAVQQGLVG